MFINYLSKSLNAILFSLIVTFILMGCENDSFEHPNYMAFNNVEYVTEFPETFSLQNKSIPNIDIIGMRNFAIYDSILILNTTKPNGLWSFYSLLNYQKYGDHLKRGEGPLEFMQGPSASSNSKITNEGDQLVAFLYDFQKGRLLKLNITKSIETNNQQLSILNDDLPPFLFNFTFIDSSRYLIKKIENSNRQQIRSFIKDGHESEISILKKLNQASIVQGEDYNILSTITKYNNKNNVFLEMPIGLNYLNIYSLDSTIAKTICIGEKLNDIEEIQKQSPEERIYTFANSRIYDDFLGVVFINEGKKNYQTNRTKLPSILLFDWNGHPLAELKLENHITSFDIDFINQELYTFDVHSDEFFKYDIKDILTTLKLAN